MEILKIVAIGIIGAFSTILLKRNNSEFATLVSIVTSSIILFLVLPSIESITTVLTTFSQKTNIESGIFTALIKVLFIGYITEYGAGIVQDLNENGIANKIKFAGKIAIFLVTMPIFSSIINLIGKLL